MVDIMEYFRQRLAQLHAENAVYLDALSQIPQHHRAAAVDDLTHRALDMANTIHRDHQDSERPIVGAIVILQIEAGGFEVVKDGRTTGHLSFDECLGHVATLMGPGRLFDARTPSEWRQLREHRAAEVARRQHETDAR